MVELSEFGLAKTVALAKSLPPSPSSCVAVASTVFTGTSNYIKNCTRYVLNLVQYRYIYAKYIVNLATEFTMYFPYTKKFKIRYFKIVVRYACNT